MRNTQDDSIQFEAAIAYLQGPRTIRIDWKSVKFYQKWVEYVRVKRH